MGNVLSPFYDTTTEDSLLLNEFFQRMYSAQSIAGLRCEAQ